MKPINSDYWVWCRSTSPHERSPCSPAFFVGNPWPRPMPSRDGRAWSSSTRSRTGAGRCVCLRDDPFRAQPAVAHAFSTFLEFRLQCEEMCKRATEASTALPSSHYYSGSSSRTSRIFHFPDSRDLLEVLGGPSWQRESPREDPLGSGRIP